MVKGPGQLWFSYIRRVSQVNLLSPTVRAFPATCSQRVLPKWGLRESGDSKIKPGKNVFLLFLLA